MKISLCTTCRDKKGQDVRLGHLQQTLLQNIADNPDISNVQVEFVVLNYGDTGGLHDWMMSNEIVQTEIANGRLIYARTNSLKVSNEFHHAHAKNMAHRLATGDVLINTDADNFVGQGFAADIATIFTNNINSILCPAKALSKVETSLASGFYGRIAISRQNFLRLGGYDEKFNADGTWGGEDTDFLRRARMACLNYVEFDDKEFIQAIPHSNELRLSSSITGVEARKVAAQAIENRSIIPETTLAKLPHKLKTVFSRVHVPLRTSLTVNEGRNFGIGAYSIFRDGKQIDCLLKPVLEGLKPFFNSAIGIKSLLRTKLEPTVISLKDQAVSPS